MFASFNRRMMFSVAASLLVHGFVLFVLSGVSVAPRGRLDGTKPIAVQLVSHAKQEDPLDKIPKVIAGRQFSEFKMRSPRQAKQESAAPEPILVATKEAAPQEPKGAAKGIAIPRAIFLPWAQGLQVRPPSTGAQPDNQPRGWLSPQQQAEMRAQMQVVQLNESVGRLLLENGKDIAGSCSPARPEAGRSPRMDCIPKSLDDLAAAEKPKMQETLEALRMAGKQIDAIFIVFRGGQLTISFHEPAPKPKTRP